MAIKRFISLQLPPLYLNNSNMNMPNILNKSYASKLIIYTHLEYFNNFNMDDSLQSRFCSFNRKLINC